MAQRSGFRDPICDRFGRAAFGGGQDKTVDTKTHSRYRGGECAKDGDADSVFNEEKKMYWQMEKKKE